MSEQSNLDCPIPDTSNQSSDNSESAGNGQRVDLSQHQQRNPSPSEFGSTDLHKHALSGSLEDFKKSFEGLKRHNPNYLEIVSMYNEDGETALSLAIKSKKFKIALYLMTQLNGKEKNDQLDLFSSISSEELDEFIEFAKSKGHEDIGDLLSHKASALKRNRHGGDFQLKLLMLFAYKGYENDYDFRLGTEVNEACKFDDLVIRYRDRDSKNYRYRFLQAKHYQHLEEKNFIKLNDLLGMTPNDNFDLSNYLDSYIEIKKNYKDGEIEDLILCTNNRFSDDVSDFVKPIDDQKRMNYEIISQLDGELYQLDFETSNKRKCLIDKVDQEKQTKSKVPKSTTFTDMLKQYSNSKDAQKRVHEFLKKLVFAVKLPSSLRFSREIRDMMGSNAYNFIRFVTFKEYMGEWFAERRPDNKARFILSSEIKNFFDKLKNKIAKLELNGLSPLFTEKIPNILRQLEFSVESEDMKTLQEFLNSDANKILKLVYVEKDSLLSIAKVYQIIKNKYQDADAYSISDLQTLSSLGETVLSALKSENTNLLVIDCNIINEEGKELINNLCRVLGKSKKLILVLNNNKINELDALFSERLFCKVDMKNALDSFTPASKNAILGIKINLFGQERKLNSLTNNNENELSLNGDALTTLFRDGSNIKIKKHEYDFDTYIDIPRTFTYQTKIYIKCLKDNTQDVFALSDITKDLLLELIAKEEKVEEFKGKISDKENTRYYIIYDSKDFDKLCSEYTHNIHFLEYKDSNSPLEWKQSRGSLINLRRFLVLENEQPMSITDLTNSAIIAGEPGMGKSTLMTTFSRKSKSPWPIKINLKSDEERIQEANFGDLNGVVTFLTNIISRESSQTSLISNLLHYSLMQQSQVILFLDGYDEVKDHSKEKIVQLLKTLKTTLGKVFITTRSYARFELEDALGMFAYSLNPFNEEEQKKFFNKFWIQKLQDLNSEENINMFTDQLLNHLLKLNLMKKENLVGIALQARMVAEVFQEMCKKYRKSTAVDIDSFGVSNIFNLYEKFIERQYERYLKEKIQISEKLTWGSRNALTMSYTKSYGYLALKSLFSEYQIQGLLTKEIFLEKELKAIGLIKFVKEDGTAVFLHHTYAEYFVADFLVNMLRKKKEHPKFRVVDKFFRMQIFKNRNEIILKFVELKEKNLNDSDLRNKWTAIEGSDLLKGVGTTVNLQLENDNLDSLDEENDKQSLRELQQKVEDCMYWISKWEYYYNNDPEAELISKLFKKFLKEKNINELESALNFLLEANGKSKYGKANNMFAEFIDRAVVHYLNESPQEGISSSRKNTFEYNLMKVLIGEPLPKLLAAVKALEKGIADERSYKVLIDSLIPKIKKIDELDELVRLNCFHNSFRLIFPSDTFEKVKSYIVSDENRSKELVERIIEILNEKIDRGYYIGILDSKLGHDKELKYLKPFFSDILYDPKVDSFTKSCIRNIYKNYKDIHWLERNGVLISRILEILTPEMSDTFNSILENKLDDYTRIYSNGVFHDLMIYFVNRLAEGEKLPQVDKPAFLKMLVSFIKFFGKAKAKITFTSEQLKATLELVKNILNVPNPDSMAESLDYLFILGNEGLKVIDAVDEILVLDPASEFEYKYQFSADYVRQIIELIKWRKGNPESLQFFEKCQKVVETID